MFYWDRLQKVIHSARTLQCSPIPDSRLQQRLNLIRLRVAEYAIGAMLKKLPHIHTPPPDRNPGVESHPSQEKL